MSDRRQALVFIATVLVASWGFEAWIVLQGGVRAVGPLGIVALMCLPGLLSLLLRWVLGAGFADVGWRLGQWRYLASAIGVPVALAALLALVASFLDLRSYAPVPAEGLVGLVPALILVLGLGLLGAFGEELGWRGFLLPRLVTGGVAHPYLVCAAVWAAWHLPLIAFGGFYDNVNPLPMAAIYALGIVAMSFFFSELRMRSGSVWTATLAHATHNFCFQFVVPAVLLTAPGAHPELWDVLAGDTGLGVALAYTVAWLVFRGARGPEPVGGAPNRLPDRPAFHLSLPVLDLGSTERFYRDRLGARMGRRERDWIDVILFGHQLTFHQRPGEVPPPDRRGVQHFGVVLAWPDWEALGQRLVASGAALRLPPTRFAAGTPQEHGKLLLEDPSGHLLEFKAYRDAAAVVDRATG